jgi:SAM-dependent methyltransferase
VLSDERHNGRMKVSTSATLECSVDAAWDALHAPAIFRNVSAPFTSFRTEPREDLPTRFQTNRDYPITVMAARVVPLGRQTIHLVDEIGTWAERTVEDRGRGESGPLSMLHNWRHRMTVTARRDGKTDFSDVLTADAGWLTPFAWLGLQVFWLWRRARLTALSKNFDAAITRSWNGRYAEKSAMWSGKVNPVLEAVAEGLAPGRALDVGCGEGADALHLAQLGWDTLGVEASSVALWRAHEEATSRSATTPLRVDWRVANIAEPWHWREGEYDLVSLQFIHTDPASRAHIWAEALNAVAPGGTLVIVGHDEADAAKGVRRPPAELCFDVDQLRALVPKDWSAVFSEVRERIQVVDGEEKIVGDVVLIASR